MLLNTYDSYYVRVVTLHCSFTCLYMSILLLYLMYTNNLYSIGKYSCIPLVIAITLAEFIKCASGLLINDANFNSKVKSSKLRMGYSRLKLKEITKSVGVIIFTLLVYYILAVLFGAPLFSEYEETFMLSALVTSLTAVPCCLNIGADIALLLFAGHRPEGCNLLTSMTIQNFQWTVLGSWLGAIVIPLDWDRPWQQWPISCCLGAVLGNIVSQIITLIKLMPSIIKVFTGKTFVLSKCWFVSSKVDI